MANRFCSGCGAKLVSGANFCVECGEAQGGARPLRRARGPLVNERYAPLFVLFTVVLVAAGAIVYGRYNQVPRAHVARPDAPGGAPGSAAQSTGQGSAPLPQDHPPIQIPEEVKASIRDMAKKAADAPDDLAAWKQVADVQYRAGQLEPQYLADAEASYRHIVAKDPDNLDAIRGLGNVAYDQQKPEEAIRHYEQFLARKPDDPEVRTDLGTMYLSSGNSKKALEIYQNVLQAHPKFFQAQFNLSIAYRGLGDNDKSLAALEKARELAPDERTRTQVDQLLARMKGEPPAASAAAADPHAGMMPGAAPAPGAAALAAAQSFQAAAEAVFRQNPVMGSKVQRIEWSGELAAKVYLREFPMDQMGPEMKNMFGERMRGRIKEQKTRFQVAGGTSFELIDEASGRVMDTLRE
jgi:tetratricopeptide (TPR) repeat protein